FFFSSRRRHTRSYGDWSSDVCSSDLLSLISKFHFTTPNIMSCFMTKCTCDASRFCYSNRRLLISFNTVKNSTCYLWTSFPTFYRSEERRVGKEFRFCSCGEDI